MSEARKRPMTSRLEQKVRTVARRARTLVRLHAAGWSVALVCLAALLVGLADYVARFQDLGVRLFCSALVAAAAGWAFTRFVFPAWRYRCTDLHAARRIERQFPDLMDRLSSAIAFSAQSPDDELAGSLQLRRSVIRETEVATEPLDFAACLDRRRPMRAVLAAVVVVGLLLILGFIDGPSVSLAARRLITPWGQETWPRRHVLEFTQAPQRLAAGQDFEVELIDANGRLPDHVEIHYWFEGDDAAAIETQMMQPLVDKAVHRLTNVTRSFRYRATGGDDQKMPWRTLTVVAPARVIERELTLEPPAYTGLESRAADGDFRALCGTRVTLRGRASKPLSLAVLETDTTDTDLPLNLALDDDRCGFTLSPDAPVSWLIAKSGTYAIRLIDSDGVDAGVSDRWDVDAVPDLPPAVSLKRPAGDLFLTTRGTAAIDAIVRDDLSIRSVELRFTRSSRPEEGEQKVVIWSGPRGAASGSNGRPNQVDEGVQRAVEFSWQVSQLPLLQPGEWIDFYLAASDYRPQEGESVRRRLSVISHEEFEERIVQRQSEILAQIAEVARLETQTQRQVADLEIPLRDVGTLDQEDIDQLQGSELNQRQVQQRLGHPSDGIASQIDSLIDELQSNRINSPDMLRRLEELRTAIGMLSGSLLPEIQHQMVDALKLAREDWTRRQRQPDASADQRARETLRGLVLEASEGQLQVINALEEILGRLSQWDNYRKLAQEVSRLRREQQEVRQQTEELRRQTLTKDVQDLSDQERASLNRLTERQNGVALHFESLQSRLETTRRHLAEDDPRAAESLTEALDMVRRTGLAGAMRDVAREMGGNRLGQASEQQQTVIQHLTDLQDILAHRQEQKLDRVADQLQDATGELEALRADQDLVQQAFEDPASLSSDRLQALAARESQLAERSRQLATRLRRLRAGDAETALRQAGSALQSASQAAEQEEVDRAGGHGREAQSHLAQARDAMLQALQRLEQSLIDDKLIHLRQSLLEVQRLEQQILDETKRIDQGRAADAGSLARELAEAIATLASEQNRLGQEVVSLGTSVDDLEAFAIALREVSRNMDEAARKLGQRDTGSATQQCETTALAGISHIVDALQGEEPSTSPSGQMSPPAPRPPDEQERARNAHVLAQLKIIRAMQQDLNQKTVVLDREVVASPTWSESQVAEQQQLVRLQGQLAELLRGLLEPDALPEVAAPEEPPTDPLQGLDRAIEQNRKKE